MYLRQALALLLASCSLLGAPRIFAAEEASSKAAQSLTLTDLSSRLAQNNLEILAARLNVQTTEALKAQAEIWPNPSFQVGQNIYNPETKRYFDTGSKGNTDFSLSQLLRTGGKRSAEIEVASYDQKIAEQTLKDALRTLNRDLREAFYKAYFQKENLAFYDRSIATIQSTVGKVQKSYEGRSILLSEVFRLKAMLVSLQNQRLDLLNDWTESQLTLRKLVWGKTDRVDYEIIPVLDNKVTDQAEVSRDFASYLAMAKAERPDLQASSLAAEQEQARLRLEKANAIPDLNLGVEYSRQGSYIKDYYALTLGFDLPVFNRNQGKIQAESFAAQSKANDRLKAENDLEFELRAKHGTALAIDDAYRSVDREFSNEYSALANQMVKNYEDRNISIIAFADFFEAYREGLIQINEIKLKRLIAFEELNLALGRIVLLP